MSRRACSQTASMRVVEITVTTDVQSRRRRC